MEAIDQFSSVIIGIGCVVCVISIIKLLYNIATDKAVTITNRKTGKSAQITRKYDKNQIRKLSEVLN